MKKADDVTSIIASSAKKVLADVQHRCTEALKAIEQGDHLVALGAPFGLEEQIRSINVRLLVLREVADIQKQKQRKGKT